MPEQFTYKDCQESIQTDLITMLSGILEPSGQTIFSEDIKRITDNACQIVVDNFKKITFKTL